MIVWSETNTRKRSFPHVFELRHHMALRAAHRRRAIPNPLVALPPQQGGLLCRPPTIFALHLADTALAARSSPPSTMPSRERKPVLFVTNPEFGQCNTILALALELITHPNTDVHVASFPVLRKRAEELSSSVRATEKAHPNSSFTFHEIGGMSFEEAFASKGLSVASFSHPPLARSYDKGITMLLALLTNRNGKGTTRYLCFILPLIT